MRLQYLDIETTGLDPYRDQLLTIQTHRIEDDGPVGTTAIHKTWERAERDVVRGFLDDTAFFTEPWGFVPVGFNLHYELKWLFVKGKQYGALPKHARFEAVDKPRIDLKDLAVMMNGVRFKGSKLENFSAKMGSGDIVLKAIEAQDHATIEHYIQQETDAFLRLWVELRREMPEVWKRIAPRMGVDADDPAPDLHAQDPLGAIR